MPEWCFDSWAWWEVLVGSHEGRRIWKRCEGDVVCSSLVLAEIGAKLRRMEKSREADEAMQQIRARSDVIPVDADIAVAASALHPELRKEDPQASLADAIMLATARARGAVLVSADAAFKGIDDVTRRP